MADREQIVEMIRRKAAEYDFDPDLAVRIAELESSLNPNARNRRSSATGLYQLTDARRREIGAPAKRVLSLDEQVDYGLKSLSQAAKYLEDRLERKPEPFEIYAAHFSGPMGSVKVLKADPSTPIDRVLSARAVRANPDLRGRTTGQVVGTWQEKLGDFAPKPVPVPRKEFTPGPPLDVFEFEKPAGLQLYAQGPRPEAEPVAAESVASEPQTEPMALMAEGGMVDDEESPFNQQLTRMVQMARSDSDFARINRMLAGGPQGFAGGGFIAVGFDEGGEVKKERSAKEMLADMELTPEERERLSKPAFGVVPSSGKGRKQSRVSEALQSGEAQLAAAKGMTMLPQNVAGAPVDLATLLMRPFGYNVEKPVGGSEYLKEKSRQAGVAFQEPEDPTLRAFFTAGDISSNLVNPAGATRTAVRGVEKTGEAAKALAQMAAQDPVVARTVERAIERFAPAARPMYITRPPGGGVAAMPEPGQLSKDSNATNMSSWVRNGIVNAENAAERAAPVQPGLDWESGIAEKTDAIQNFWKSKAANYVSRQMGTADDPLFKQILAGNIKSPEMSKVMPGYLVRAAAEGKTRVNPATGKEIFYPKDPQALEDLTRKYDEATGIRPMVFASDQDYVSSHGGISDAGRAAAQQTREKLIDQLVLQGVNPDLINVPVVNLLQETADGKLASSVYQPYPATYMQEAAQDRAVRMASGQGEQGGKISGAVARAMGTGEPIYDINLDRGLRDILKPENINAYLATLSPKEIGKIRFEDAVKDSAKFNLKKFEYENLQADIKAGRRVNEKFFAEGVSAPLFQFEEGPFAGFAWKRLETPESTVAEGAYVGHSVGGYALGGAGYGREKMERFTKGLNQVYSLRDNRNRPVTTIEVVLDDKGAPVVQQIKGNGRATGNKTAETYSPAVLEFLIKELKPKRITETDNYLTPELQAYKKQLEEASRNPDPSNSTLRRLFPDEN